MFRISSRFLAVVSLFIGNIVSACTPATGENGPVDLPNVKRAAGWYVDSHNGNDANDGRSKSQAWQSFENIVGGTFSPVDTLYIKRGSQFSGVTLTIDDSGSLKFPIVVTDYGADSDPAPSFTNSLFDPDHGQYGNCIRIKGSHVIVENMYCHGTVAEIPSTAKAPFVVMWELGAIYIDKTAENCIIRHNETYDCGVGIKSYGKNAIIEYNYVHDCNRVLKEWNWGPIGIWLGGDYQEVRYNTVINYSAVNSNINWGPDGYSSGADGGAIEIDDARVPKQNISIHHNYTRDCQGFMEVTWSDVLQKPDYRNFHVHHNVCDNYQAFVALWRGAECIFENNTIIRRKVNPVEWGVFNITQHDSRNIIRNNIIVTEHGVKIFLVGNKNNATPHSVISDNVYWAAEGELDYGYEGPGANSIVADPLFVNYSGNTAEDFQLRDDSPVKNMGKGAF